MIKYILIAALGLSLVACKQGSTKHQDVVCVFNGEVITHKDVRKVHVSTNGTWGNDKDGLYYDYSNIVPCRVVTYYTADETAEPR